MKRITAIIFENDRGEILLYMRDNKPGIPFPNHWDLFGGHVEEGETPEEALVREVKEELDYDLKDYRFFRKYECIDGDAYPNIKYIYYGRFNVPLEEITLLEGEYPRYFTREEIPHVKFANILEKRGELDNTIVIVTGDNGMPFPRVKGNAYEYSNHMPLAIMWGRGINKPGRTVDDLISFIDQKVPGGLTQQILNRV